MGLKRNPTQNRFIYDPRRFIIWSANRRCGKTYALNWGAGLDAFEIPNNVVVIGRAVKDDLWTTTYKTWRRLFPKDVFNLDYEGGEKEPKAVWFPNGSVVYFIGFDRDEKYLGLEIGSFWIDQVEQCQQSSWLTCEANIGSLPHVPVARTRGRGIGNPWGHYWAYQMCVQGIGVKQEYRSQYLWLKSPKLENLHNLPDKAIYDRLEASYPPHLRARMIEGSDDAFEGIAFPEFMFQMHVTEIPDHVVSGWIPVVGMDHGTNPNPTVMLLAWWSPEHGILYIVGEHVMGNTIPEDHVRFVRELARDLGFPLNHPNFVGDYQIKGLYTAKLRTIWQEYHEAGFTFQSAIKSIEGSLERGNKLFKHRRIFIHNRCRTLIQQLQTVSVDDKVKLVGTHDAIDAFRYLIMWLRDVKFGSEPAPMHGTYADHEKALELGGDYCPTIGDPWAQQKLPLPLIPQQLRPAVDVGEPSPEADRP